MTQAWLNRIGTAVPPHDIHAAFVEFGRDALANWHKRALFDRMARLSEIEHRFAIFEPGPKPRDNIDVQSFVWVVGKYGEAEQGTRLSAGPAM